MAAGPHPGRPTKKGGVVIVSLSLSLPSPRDCPLSHFSLRWVSQLRVSALEISPGKERERETKAGRAFTHNFFKMRKHTQTDRQTYWRLDREKQHRSSRQNEKQPPPADWE